MELFERISIGHGNRRGERVGTFVGASVECAIVPGWTVLKGLAESVCLIDVAGDPESGWSTISHKEETMAWEASLALHGPRRAMEMSALSGGRPLSQTHDARAAAARYLAKLPRSFDVQHVTGSLRMIATKSQVAEADRVIRSPIICIPDGRRYYETAALLIAIYSDEVEACPGWLNGRDPDSATDRGLMTRLQFMASVLACEPGWEKQPWT
jgi:hypothetical protein